MHTLKYCMSKEFVSVNNVHSVALSPLTKVLLDRNHGILDLISSRGGVSQLHRENYYRGAI